MKTTKKRRDDILDDPGCITDYDKFNLISDINELEKKLEIAMEGLVWIKNSHSRHEGPMNELLKTIMMADITLKKIEEVK